jgi:hypothetical protein
MPDTFRGERQRNGLIALAKPEGKPNGQRISRQQYPSGSTQLSYMVAYAGADYRLTCPLFLHNQRLASPVATDTYWHDSCEPQLLIKPRIFSELESEPAVGMKDYSMNWWSTT